MKEKKLIINMKKPFDYGDLLKIARAEAQKKEGTKHTVQIVDIICENAQFTVYYKMYRSPDVRAMDTNE